MNEKAKQAKRFEDQAIILQYLQDKSIKVLEKSCSDGWVRWKTDKLEGVVRLTASDEWQILADPIGEWDRCANAAFEIDLWKISEVSLAKGFYHLHVALIAHEYDQACSKRQ